MKDANRQTRFKGVHYVFTSAIVRTRSRVAPDMAACLVLALFVATISAGTWYFDSWLADFDKLAQFIPWFGYIGDSLRSLDVPYWNPYAGSGQPFVGAPASGWGSIPIAVSFTFVDVITGYKLFVIFHLVISTWGTYAFCRILGQGALAASIAAMVYGSGPVLYSALRWEAASGQVLMMLPVAMLCMELAIRSSRTIHVLAWGSATGVLVGQMFISSVPRVIYPVLIMVGWMLCRLLIDRGEQRFKPMLIHLAIVGVIICLAFVATSATALFAQLEYNAQTNVANANYDVPGGGYTQVHFTKVGMLYNHFADSLTINRARLNGTGATILAFVALATRRNRWMVMYFAGAAFALIAFTGRESFVRDALWLIPGIEVLTSHRPISAGAFASFPIAITAGFGVATLGQSFSAISRLGLVILPPALVGGVFLIFRQQDLPVETYQEAALAVTSVGVALMVWARSTPTKFWSRRLRIIGAPVLLTGVLLFPFISDSVMILRQPDNPDINLQVMSRIGATRSAVDRIVGRADPGTAARFLQRRALLSQPFRYVSWTGSLYPQHVFSSQTDPETIALISNGRPLRLELQSTYSYSPSQILAYVDYMEVMNGAEQDYHFTQALAYALYGDRLLDMLNVRYILVPKSLDSQPDIAAWTKLVYQDNEVYVYENLRVMPRSWIVHDVQPSQDGLELKALRWGTADGKQVAFVEGELPAVAQFDPDMPPERVTITDYQPESITLQTISSADGFLVLADLYTEEWNAYLNGEKVPVLRTNHAFRGISLPAGDHLVEFRYEPPMARTGLLITGVSYPVLIVVWCAAFVRRRPSFRPPNVDLAAATTTNTNDVTTEPPLFPPASGDEGS